GATIVEVDAGVGLHSLALAETVGDTGHVILYEARPLHHRILRQNVEANRVARATILQRYLGGRPPDATVGPPIEDQLTDSLDELGLERLDCLKINRGATATDVLDGAIDSLWRLRPTLLIAIEQDAMLG